MSTVQPVKNTNLYNKVIDTLSSFKKALKKDLAKRNKNKSNDDTAGNLESSTGKWWHFTDLRKETVTHPYIVLTSALATFILTRLIATMAFYLVSTLVVGTSLFFLGIILWNDPQKLKSSLNILYDDGQGYQVTISGIKDKIVQIFEDWMISLGLKEKEDTDLKEKPDTKSNTQTRMPSTSNTRV
jgi:hypothetical protein